MGIVNATPDSFSDGGRLADVDDAIALADRLIAEGADWLDVGGESTRPGAAPVSEAQEMTRVIPLIEAIRARSSIPLSVDTMKPSVARAAMAAGATLWNDVSALTWSPDSLAVAADLGCAVVLMHMRGEPRIMQDDPRYGDVVAEVTAYLGARADAALAAGVAQERLWLDPGIGFGKTAAHSLALLRGLGAICALGYPVLLGVSRKGFIRTVDPAARRSCDRLGGSLAAALAGAASGVAMVRVHDVRQTVQALAVQGAIADSHA
jgi:dihydropteroate synthase